MRAMKSMKAVKAMKAMKAMRAMKAMKAMKAKRAMKSGAPMSKGGLAEALAAQTDLKKAVCSKLIAALADIGAKEVNSNGLFTVHGLCRIKTRVKPATKAGKRMMFGKEVAVKAKPAKTVVKAFAVASLKQSI